MKIRALLGCMACLVGPAVIQAASIVMVTGDGFNQSSFTAGTNWPGGVTPPSSSNDYFVNSGQLIRTPAATGNFQFGGQSLTLTSGGTLAFKGNSSAQITVATLNLNGGVVSNWQTTGTVMTLAGNIILQSGGGIFDLNGNLGGVVSISSISGTGSLLVKDAAATIQDTNKIVLQGTNTYTGGTTVSSNAFLVVQGAGALGTGNVSVTGGVLELDQAAISGSASLLLANSLAAGSIKLSFSGTDSITGLSFDGGTTFAEAGTWGALDSTAEHKSALFTGAGVFDVVPEPPAWMLLGVACLGLGVLSRRRVFSRA